jgi:hypothetical protein
LLAGVVQARTGARDADTGAAQLTSIHHGKYAMAQSLLEEANADDEIAWDLPFQDVEAEGPKEATMIRSVHLMLLLTAVSPRLAIVVGKGVWLLEVRVPVNVECLRCPRISSLSIALRALPLIFIFEGPATIQEPIVQSLSFSKHTCAKMMEEL